jgi:DNA repair protein RadA/Sms
VDFNRVNLLMAVLEKRLGLHLSTYDAYVNIAGGLKMNEPALDLAIVLALASSYKNRPVDEGLICFGEVGLSGEVRSVSQAQQRINEAKKLGFTTIVLPKVCLKNIQKEKDVKLIGVENVYEVYDLL